MGSAVAIINELAPKVSTSVNLNKSTSWYANLLAMECFHQIAIKGIEFQRLLLSKILKHPIWKDVLPKKINLEDAHNTLNNLSKGWQFVKGNHSKDDQHARNFIIPMVASNSIHSICHTNALTGIHWKNFKQDMERRLFLESQMDKAIWAFCGKAKRKDVLSFEICNVVVKFWIDNTWVSPNMKDVVKRHLARKSWESHTTHLLLES